MRNMLAAAFVLLAVTPALADHLGHGNLDGTTALRIKNGTSEFITSIVAVNHGGFFGSTVQPIYAGAARPGAVFKVVFPGCWEDIHVVTKRGPHDSPSIHSINNFNVCGVSNYVITDSWWGR